MPKLYDRECDYCGARYRNQNPRFCSRQCYRAAHPPKTKKSSKKSFNKEEMSVEYQQNNAIVSVNSLTICTLEEALEIANVDLEIWEVDRYIVNSWQVTMNVKRKEPVTRTNWQVKVWLKRKKIQLSTGLTIYIWATNPADSPRNWPWVKRYSAYIPVTISGIPMILSP